MFVYDRDRRLRYHGAIDDNRDETGVSQQYLRDALDALLDGNDPAVAETPAVGCTVKWLSFRALEQVPAELGRVAPGRE